MLENKIVKGILNEFAEEYGMKELQESKLYEYLANFLIVSRIHPEAFEEIQKLEDIDVDDGSNFGIDGIAIIINNNLVLAKEEIEIYRKSKNLDVNFIFIQTKTSSNYDGGDIYKFIGAVENFFSTEPKIPLSKETLYFRGIAKELMEYDNARFFEKTSPKCTLFYITSGKPINDATINGIVEQGKTTISTKIPELKEVKINLYGSENIIDMYNEFDNRFDVVINFKNNLSLDEIKGITQSYIGYLSAEEFLKLISNNDGNLRRNLFYENVRDFQGIDNTVNKEIYETLSIEELQDKFIILNNGVTIVAKQFKSLGSNNFELKDFQIVNGCQTSNVIHAARNVIKGNCNVWIPIKIIHTNESEVINRITRATNRQSPISEEAFIALEKFHKRLQEFYYRMSEELSEKIYYERRSKEFSNDSKIEKYRIVSLHYQIRAFASIYLNEPHYAYANNPNEILRSKRNLFFNENDSYYPYFTANYIMFFVRKYMNRSSRNEKYLKYTFYIGMIIRMLITKKLTPPHFNSFEIEKECKIIINVLTNETEIKSYILKATDIIEEAIKNKFDYSHRQTSKNLAFKEEVFSRMVKYLQK